MKKTVVAAIALIAAGVLLCLAQPAAQVQQPGGRGGQRRRAGGRGSGGGIVVSAPVGSEFRYDPAGSGGPANMVWLVRGDSAAAFRQLTFVEAAAKADTLGLGSILGSSGQKVAPEIPKNLDYHLMPGERAAITGRLRELNVQMRAYRVEMLDGVREWATQIVRVCAGTWVLGPSFQRTEAASLAAVDKLANEFGVNVAIENRNPKKISAGMEGRSKRIGVMADLGARMQEGIKPVDGLALVKDRLLAVSVRDRSAAGPKGRDVTLGSGGAGVADFFSTGLPDGIEAVICLDRDNRRGGYLCGPD